MSKKNHHYVPQFHLRNFSNNKKSIGMFINKKGAYIKEASIKEQAYKKYLYGKTDDIENGLMKIENYVANVIRKIIERQELPSHNSEEYHTLLLYLLFAEARVEKIADSQNNLINTQMKLLAKMDKRFNGSIEDIDKINIGYEIPNLPPLQVAAENYPILLDLSAILIISGSDRRFITSDAPLIRYNQMYVNRNYQLRGYGLGNMGIQLFYTISPKICLCLYDSTTYECIGCSNQTVYIRKGKEIDELNKLFYINSLDYLFFNQDILETYIRRITNGLIPVHNVKKEISIFGSDNDKFIIFQNSFVKDKIKLQFMRIKQNIPNMPLPEHMAGPIRPYAGKFMDDRKR
jgi:hypothetical protein